MRVNGSQCSHRAAGLTALQGRTCRLLLYACLRHDAIDILLALSLAGCARHDIGGPTVDESTEIGHKERVLDIGQGGEGLDFGICSR